MAVGPLHNATVILTPGELSMKQQVNMAIFQITNWKLDFKSGRRNGLQVSIMMRRKVTSELMTTFFPTILLTTITFATTFFKPFFFEAALSVNLTTMLVMTTIFISKMESLPPTSDIKMIDIWLILCQMVPFAEVVLLTAMEYNRVDTKEEKKGSRQTPSLVVVPANGSASLDEFGEGRQGRISFNCGFPSLKTVGKHEVHFSLILTFYNKMTYLFPESRVLPSVVVFSFFVYFGIALAFSYQF